MKSDERRAYAGPGRPVMRGYEGGRLRSPPITSRSIEVFGKMLALADDDFETWDALESDLMDALKLPPWCFPPVLPPDDDEGADGTGIAATWAPMATALWIKLVAAVSRRQKGARGDLDQCKTVRRAR